MKELLIRLAIMLIIEWLKKNGKESVFVNQLIGAKNPDDVTAAFESHQAVQTFQMIVDGKDLPQRPPIRRKADLQAECNYGEEI